MRRNLKTLAIIFSVVLNLTFAASYTWRQFRTRPRFAYEELNLTDDQRARFEAGRARFLRQVDQINAAMAARNVEVMDLIAAESPDEKAIQARLAEVCSAFQTMQDVTLKHLLEDRLILQDGQRKRFFEILKSRIRSQYPPGPTWVPRGEGTR